MVENYRVEHIKKVHENRRQSTQQKIDIAIKSLIQQGKSVNFNSVSKEANVSITTLYNNKIIKEQIISLRQQMNKPVGRKNLSATDESAKAVINSLKNRIKKLENENKELKEFIKQNFEKQYQDL